MAINTPFVISKTAQPARKAQNNQWAQAVINSAKSRSADLFSKDWWQKKSSAMLTNSDSTGKSHDSWWGSTPWSGLCSAIGIEPDSKPLTYVYDQNVTFKNDVISVNGFAVSSYETFVASARAAVKSTGDTSPSNSTWTPIGTFALSTSLKSKSTPHAIQLAVDKAGNIGGVYANWKNGSVLPIHGKVCLDSQRVVFQIGQDGKIVAETGLKNLTNNITRLWAHLPDKHSQTWLLVRL